MTQVLKEPSEIARSVVEIISDRQGESVVMLDVSQVASFTDYFVIATALNPRHMGALLNGFDKDLANEGIHSLRTEGSADSGWVLVDFGAVIVHLFTPADREYYNLEALWERSGVPAVRFQ